MKFISSHHFWILNKSTSLNNVTPVPLGRKWRTQAHSRGYPFFLEENRGLSPLSTEILDRWLSNKSTLHHFQKPLHGPETTYSIVLLSIPSKIHLIELQLTSKFPIENWYKGSLHKKKTVKLGKNSQPPWPPPLPTWEPLTVFFNRIFGLYGPWNGFWEQLIFFPHKSGLTLRKFFCSSLYTVTVK